MMSFPQKGQSALCDLCGGNEEGYCGFSELLKSEEFETVSSLGCEVFLTDDSWGGNELFVLIGDIGGIL